MTVWPSRERMGALGSEVHGNREMGGVAIRGDAEQELHRGGVVALGSDVERAHPRFRAGLAVGLDRKKSRDGIGTPGGGGEHQGGGARII